MLKPSFVRLTQISPALSGSLKPSFVRLSSISPALTSGLQPSFVRLRTLNISSVSALKPAFTRLAKIDAKILPSIRPKFIKMVTQHPALSNVALSPGKKVPVLKVPKLSTFKPVQLYQLPIQLKTAKLAYTKKIRPAQTIMAPQGLYQLSFTPAELRSISTDQIVQILQRDLHLIQPELAQSSAAGGYKIGPHSVSLRSILAAEAK